MPTSCRLLFDETTSAEAADSCPGNMSRTESGAFSTIAFACRAQSSCSSFLLSTDVALVDQMEAELKFNKRQRVYQLLQLFDVSPATIGRYSLPRDGRIVAGEILLSVAFAASLQSLSFSSKRHFLRFVALDSLSCRARGNAEGTAIGLGFSASAGPHALHSPAF